MSPLLYMRRRHHLQLHASLKMTRTPAASFIVASRPGHAVAARGPDLEGLSIARHTRGRPVKFIVAQHRNGRSRAHL